ncbi:MAG: hypothetical protein K0S09_1368 [Sphingobacteriaceae bacterium]|jgi:gas vesicle protein|nr:hypothetical protein [Sphingobacteriaceae bacterium]
MEGVTVKQNCITMNYKRTISKYLDNRKTDPARVVVALLAGLAVGAVLGVLFAPESGEETRYRISDGAKGLANGAKDRFQAMKSRFRPELDRISEDGAEMAKDVKSKAKSAISTAKDSVENATDKIKSKAKNVSVDQNGSIQGI